MSKLTTAPPCSPIEPVTEVLHGISITDPYRWLEEQDSLRTREWLRAQNEYARSYLESIPGRDRIRRRVEELLDVETYDSLQKSGQRYFFRKRLRGQEQFCIYFRDGANGNDQLLIDPAERNTGPYTAVKPLRVSQDGRLLLYEVKQGGERTGTFEILDVQARTTLPDVLPRGYLRGFAFASDSRSFYYVHESPSSEPPFHRLAYRHVLGTNFKADKQIFDAGEGQHVRLQIIPGEKCLGFLILHFSSTLVTDFFLWPIDSPEPANAVIRHAQYKFGPLLIEDDRIIAITDRDAPNFRIVEVRLRSEGEPEFRDVVPHNDAVIQSWAVAGKQAFVSYAHALKSEIRSFALSGQPVDQLPIEPDGTVRLIGTSENTDELLFEQESFSHPTRICRYSPSSRRIDVWASRPVPFDSKQYSHRQVWFNSIDGTRIPMYLVKRRDLLEGGPRPTIMTSYGGYGVSMTPQFSVFVACLMEVGCLFALPNIRGGSEFGAAWHEAARRQNRQVAFNDFISAAEWLIETGETESGRLAIFGGSNSGLLVGAAMTQKPSLFRAVLCMVPMLDMLRYHRFDNAHVWKEEFGTAEDSEDFSVLSRYSPYHAVRDGTAYPATMIVSGDSDQSCNPLHARKMTARLQAASRSARPILLDYTRYRGHAAVLPLGERIEALTDRIAFFCNQLDLMS